MGRKNLKEAAEFLDISEAKLRRLMRQKRIGFYGERFEQKFFSMEKHLLPYLSSIEQKPEAVNRQPQKQVPRLNYSYQEQTDLFENLTV